MQGGIGRNEWPVLGVLYVFFRSCRFSKDSTFRQHTFSSVLFLFCFIFKVHNFFSNCLSQIVLYSNLMRFFYLCKFSEDNIFQQNTFSFVLFLLALHPRYIDCFQIIKLWTMKLAKCIFFKDGGPAFDLCPLWRRDVHSLSALHTTIL